VLLSPHSIGKPWVNQEMDAGLIRKIRDQSRFIALRHKLPAEQLPQLLSGMLSPEIDETASNLQQLINDIHGVSRKPALGPSPLAMRQPTTGYTAAATTTNAMFIDPQLTLDDLVKETNLSNEDVRDALHEIRDMVDDRYGRVRPREELFVTFDAFFMDWNPADDALRLAADLVNDGSFPHAPRDIATRYAWLPRRLNPALSYLANRKLICVLTALDMAPFVTVIVEPTDATRRFVRSRS
jgi:hypothetical protein